MKKQLPNSLSLLSLLSNRHYRFLLTSTTLWWSMLFMEFIAMGWLVLDLTNSPGMVAFVGFFRSVPFLISGFIGGPLTDRVGRRRLIQITQGMTTVVYALIALLAQTDHLAIWHLAALSFLLGVCWSLDFPARRSLIPDLVGRERTVDGLLLESFAQGAVRMVGPFLAGLLIAKTGAFGCFLVMSLLSTAALIGVLALGNQPIERLERHPSEPAWRMVKDGFRYVSQNPPILAVVLVTIVMNLLIFPYITLLPVFARDVLGQGPTGLGLLGTSTGIGSFLGILLINRLRHHLSEGVLFMVGTLLQCVFLALFALSTLFPISWIFLFLSGIGQSCFTILQSSIVILTSSDDMRSRSMSTVILAIGADPLGKIQIGFLAERFGAPKRSARKPPLQPYWSPVWP